MPTPSVPWKTSGARSRSATARRIAQSLVDGDAERAVHLARLMYEDWAASPAAPAHGLPEDWDALPPSARDEYEATARAALLGARFPDPEAGARYVQEDRGRRYAAAHRVRAERPAEAEPKSPEARDSAPPAFDQLDRASQQGIRDLLSAANALISTGA